MQEMKTKHDLSYDIKNFNLVVVIFALVFPPFLFHRIIKKITTVAELHNSDDHERSLNRLLKLDYVPMIQFRK